MVTSLIRRCLINTDKGPRYGNTIVTLMRLTVATTSSGVYSLSKNFPTVRSNRTDGQLSPETYKDNFPLKCNSSVVYKIECESCGSSATYVGKTINTIHERFYGANGHLHPSTKSTAPLDHLAANVTPTCEFNTNNIKILDACTGDLKLRFAESIHLKHSKQTLNTQERSIPHSISVL